jgi:hypothetical protein
MFVSCLNAIDERATQVENIRRVQSALAGNQEKK